MLGGAPSAMVPAPPVAGVPPPPVAGVPAPSAAGGAASVTHQQVLDYLQTHKYERSLHMLTREKHAGAAEKMEWVSKETHQLPDEVFGDPGERPKPRSIAVFRSAYTRVRSFVQNSLDLYREELTAVLYPFFVHIFLEMVSNGFADEACQFLKDFRHEHDDLHATEIHKLLAVKSVDQMNQSEQVALFKMHQIELQMCTYSFKLLVSFLQDSQLYMLLAVLNQHIRVNVVKASGSRIYTPLGVKANDEVNRKDHTQPQDWGLAEDDVDVAAVSVPSLHPLAKRAKINTGCLKVHALAAPKTQEGKINLDLKQEKLNELFLMAPPPAFPRWCVGLIASALSYEQLNSHSSLIQLMHTICNSHDGLNTACFDWKGSMLSAGFSDSSIMVWGAAQSSEAPPAPCRLVGHSGPVFSTSFSPDGRFLLSSSEDTTARLWSLETRSNLMVFRGHNYPVWSVAFDPRGHLFATGGHDGTARLWCMDRPDPLRIFSGHLSDVDCVAFHPNGQFMATSSTDKTVRLWDTRAQRAVPARLFTGHRKGVGTLAFSPNGQYLASAGEDASVKLWDLAAGCQINEFVGHNGPVYGLNFSAEGGILASGSADHTIRLWDTSGPIKTEHQSATKPLKSFATNNASVFAVQFGTNNLLNACGTFNMLN